jgi:hypothetical protein
MMAAIRQSVQWLWSRPRRAYEGLQSRRDWVLTKIEYLQAESAKWRTAFNILKAPYLFLRAMGFSPQIATSLLIAGSVAGTGVVVDKTLLDGRSFSRGDSGTYQAPGDAPIFYSDGDNTLRVDLGSVEVEEISIEDVTVGTAFTGSTLPTGQTNVVEVGGLPASTGFTETFIETNHLIIDRNRCTQLIMTNVEAYELNIKWNASDGQSIAPSPGTPRARAIGGGNRAKGMQTSGGTYDRIVVQARTSGVNGKVDKLRFYNLLTKGGPCVFDRIKAGIIDILYNEIGNGDGFAAKDLKIATSTVYRSFTNTDNVEVTISPP